MGGSPPFGHQQLIKDLKHNFNINFKDFQINSAKFKLNFIFKNFL